MAVSLSLIAAKDGAASPAQIAGGGLQAQDKSGTGAGPFTLGHVMIDGLAGTNMAAVTAANAVKTDGSAVTQPVSGTVTAAQATAASLNATVVGTGTFAVQAAATLAAETTKVIGTVNLSAAQTLATVTNLSQLGGTAISMGTGVRGTGVQRVTIATDDLVPAKISDGTNAMTIRAASTGAAVATDIAAVVTIRDVNANVQGGAPVTVGAVVPTATANGSTSSRVKAAASTNATNLKASAGQVYSVDFFNNAAYAVYFKLYNKASAPTVGTDTPVWTIPVAAGGGFSREFPRGKTFATGIAYAITKLEADSDTTVVVADDLTGSIDWV